MQLRSYFVLCLFYPRLQVLFLGQHNQSEKKNQKRKKRKIKNLSLFSLNLLFIRICLFGLLRFDDL